MVENASLFLSYVELQDALRRVTHRPREEDLPLHLLALAAGGSGAITSFLLFVKVLFWIPKKRILIERYLQHAHRAR